MEIKRFNRHENMSNETRIEILFIIREMITIDGKTFNLENMLYGLFDGYDYSDTIMESEELKMVTSQNPELAIRIAKICGVIDSYPKYEESLT
jgi:hypothetical protein